MIQLGLPPTMILETDPNWDKHSRRPPGITRRFVLAMGIMSVALVLLGLPIVLIVASALMPSPVSYQNIPFPVCSPRNTQICIPTEPDETFEPGDVVPILASRCIQNVLSTDEFLPYTVNRNVTNVQTSVRIILPDFASAAPNGCTTSISLANQLPMTIAPGQYYFEGVATTYTRFGARNAYWRTQAFFVTKPD